MSNIEHNVVSMTFDNEQFEKRMTATLNSLDKLSESLKFAGAQRGFGEISAAADRFNLSKMANGIENISHKFSAMGIAGLTVINNLVSGALNAVKRVGEDILGPIISGGKTRAGNIEQARFQFRGLGFDVEKSMDSALKAVQGTAYGLDEAARIAAQLGASGIQAGDQMTGALRGIAGAAAMTGKSFSEIGDIFASSAGSGVVNNQDLMQFATRGLNAASAIAKVMGTTEESVHEMASNGELDFKTFADAMNKAFGEHATKANETYSGSLANLHAAMSRLGASFFGPEQEQQRDLFNALTPVIDNVTKALKPLITAFIDIRRIGIDNAIRFLNNLDLSNFTKAIPNIALGMRTIFGIFNQLKEVAKDAFGDVFPPSHTSHLLQFSEAFAKFADWLKPGIERLGEFKNVFRGVFAIFDIIGHVISGVAGLIKGLFSSLDGGHGAAMDFLSWLGYSLYNLDQFLVKGGALQRFFDRLAEWIRKPIPYIQELADKIVSFFTGIQHSKAAEDSLGRIRSRFDTVVSFGDRFSAFGDKVKDVLDKTWGYIHQWFSELGQKVAESLMPGDFDTAVDTVNIGLLGGITLMLKKFLSGEGMKKFLDEGKLNFDIGGGIADKIKGTFDTLGDTLKNMQIKVKADALMKIAKAVGILVVSVVALSLIDSDKLTKALVAIAVGFGELVGVMTAMDKLLSKSNPAKISGMAAAMMLVATAVDILSIAIAHLGNLDLGSLAKGLGGVAVGLGLMVTALQFMGGNTEGLVRAGIALGAMAIAMRILANAVEAFANMSWAEMAQGLTGVGVGLAAIVTAMNMVPTENMVAAGIAITTIAVGLRILANATQAFATMSLGELAKGLGGVAVGLGLMVTAMQFIAGNTEGTVRAAVAIDALAVAMVIVAKAVEMMGNIPFGELIKGLAGVAAAMVIMVAAGNAMEGSLPGAAAMVVMAGGLLILAEVLKVIGKMPIAAIITGIATIAAVIVVLAISAALLSEVIPVMFALGAAMALVGASFALFGVGAYLVVKAFTALSDAGVKGIDLLIVAIDHFIKALPMFIAHLAASLLKSTGEIIKSADLVIRVVGAFIEHLMDTIVKVAPKIGAAFGSIIEQIVIFLNLHYPALVDAGFNMLIAFLKGVRDNIDEITKLAVDILEKFLNTLADNIGRLSDAGMKMFHAIIDAISSHATEITGAGLLLLEQFLLGISQNIKQAIDVATYVVISILAEVARNILKVVQAGADILVALLKGISNNIVKVANTVADVVVKFIETLGSNELRIIDAGFRMLKAFVFGILHNLIEVTNMAGQLVTTLIDALGSNVLRIMHAGVEAIDAFLYGLGHDITKLMKAGTDMAIHILEGAADDAVFFADKAAKVLIKFLNGMATAIRTNGPEIRKAAFNLADAIIDGLTLGLSNRAGEVGDKLVDIAKKGVGLFGKVIGFGSPAKAFIEMGESMMQGVAVGLGQSSADRAVVAQAESIVSAFHETLQRANDALPRMDEFNPTITPVLDLTKVQAASRELDGLLKVSSIIPGVSLEQARLISTTAEQAKHDADTPVYSGPAEVNFTQINNSPEALSVNQIYKNTRSQIALAKEELSIP